MRIVLLLAAILLTAATMPAAAQINPFKSSKTGPKLSKDDTTMLFASLDKLNGASDVAAGSQESWSNPATGSNGTSKVTRVFPSKGLTCHRVHTEISAAGRKPPRPYETTWCKTADGSWKVRG